MSSNNGEKNTVLRQIEIDSEVYSEIETITNQYNKQNGFVKRKEKTHIKDMIPKLVEIGVESWKKENQ